MTFFYLTPYLYALYSDIVLNKKQLFQNNDIKQIHEKLTWLFGLQSDYLRTFIIFVFLSMDNDCFRCQCSYFYNYFKTEYQNGRKEYFFVTIKPKK